MEADLEPTTANPGPVLQLDKLVCSLFAMIMMGTTVDSHQIRVEASLKYEVLST